MSTTDIKAGSARLLYTQQRLLFMTLDPVHIGAGGYRLGRVDMAIAREPGTNLPKIPGTSLAGAARSYAAMRYGKPEVAGQQKNFKGEGTRCPIIYTFGTATDTSPWLLFTATKGLKVTPPSDIAEWPAISGRIVLVTPKLFSQIVNSNLEVRTSVSIDPATGAAAQGALFTYEAIPRTTWLWSDVIEDDYRTNDDGTSAFPPTSNQCKIEKNEKGEKSYKDDEGTSLGETWNRPLDVVRAGTRLIEYLGIGGMGTRGFGRMRLVAEWNTGGAQ